MSVQVWCDVLAHFFQQVLSTPQVQMILLYKSVYPSSYRSLLHSLRGLLCTAAAGRSKPSLEKRYLHGIVLHPGTRGFAPDPAEVGCAGHFRFRSVRPLCLSHNYC